MRGQNLQRRTTGKRARRCLLAGFLVASGQSGWADQPAPWQPLPLVAPGLAELADHPFLQLPTVGPLQPSKLQPAPTAALPRPQTVVSRHLSIVPGSANLPTSQAAVADHVAAQTPATPETQTSETPLQWQAAAVPAPAKSPTDGPGNLATATDESMVEIVRPLPLVPLDLSATAIAAIGTAEADVAAQPVGYSVSFSDNTYVETDDSDRLALIRPAAPLLSVEPAPAVELSFSDTGSSEQPIRQAELELVPSRAAMRPVQSWQGADVPDQPRLVNGARPRVEVERSTVAVDRMTTPSIVSSSPRVLSVEGLPEPAPELQLGPGPSVEFVDVRQSMLSGSRMLQSVLDGGNASDSWRPQAMPPRAANAEAVQLSLSGGDSEAVVQPPTQLQLNPTDVRSIKLDATIVDIQCDNLDVCTLIRSTPSSLQVIATGQGRAHLVVHAVNKDGREQVEQYVITVGHSRHADDSIDGVAMALTHTVQNAFPGANVLVSADGGRLTVTGSSPDEDTARRILRMIRSACVVPVIDKVVVR